MANRIANIKTNMGTIRFELLEQDAPKTTENFITLAERGYYDGVIFHRVIKGFMIQGGDPTGTGRGGEAALGGGFSARIHPSSERFRGPDTKRTVSMPDARPDTHRSQRALISTHHRLSPTHPHLAPL